MGRRFRQAKKPPPNTPFGEHPAAKHPFGEHPLTKHPLTKHRNARRSLAKCCTKGMFSQNGNMATHWNSVGCTPLQLSALSCRSTLAALTNNGDPNHGNDYRNNRRQQDSILQPYELEGRPCHALCGLHPTPTVCTILSIDPSGAHQQRRP